MTPPVLLTAPTPLPDADTDYARRAPFGVLLAHAATPASLPLTIPLTDADSADASRVPRAARPQWTGAPIRATAPLPRRKLGVAMPQPPRGARAPSSRRTSARRTYMDESDTEDECADADACEGRGGDGDGDARHSYSYESITAAEGLAAWSFEELRVECYAQSLVARGTKPAPIAQPSLAIPPAFVPRVVLRT